VNSDGTLHIDPDRLGPAYRRPFSGHYFQVVGEDASLRSRSLWDESLIIPALATGQHQRLRQAGPRAQPLLVFAQAYRKQGRALTVAVAEDLSAIENAVTAFQRRFAITAGLMLALLIAVQGVLVYTGLRPLERIRRDLRELERGDVRTLNGKVPTEIRPLVSEINRLASALGARLQRSRNSLGDLAHALKKPLTLMRQLARDEALSEQPRLRETLNQQTEVMQKVIDRVLRRARLAGEGPAMAYFVIAEDVAPLVEMLEKLHPHKSIMVDVAAAERTLPYDREDMLELLGNLLDNACKWAKREVHMSVACDHALSVVIEDDGPGVGDAELSRLARRGARLDTDREGHGLGLAIVKDIVSYYHGRIEFGRSAKYGGFRVVLQLPLVAKQSG
jgi:signal transduction histidine kinase